MNYNIADYLVRDKDGRLHPTPLLLKLSGVANTEEWRKILRERNTNQEEHWRREAGAKCKTCLDIGVLRWDVDFRDPKFGQLVHCPDCKTGMESRQNRAGIPESWRGKRFFNCQVIEGQIESVTILKGIVDGSSWQAVQSGFLTLWGEYGCGKTHLLMCLVNGMLDKGIPARYYTGPMILDYLRSAFDPRRDPSDANIQSLYRKLQTVPVLVVDEVLGKHKATEWADEAYHILFDYRYMRRHELLTVMALNEEPKDQADYLMSRMQDSGAGAVIHISCGDLRREVKKFDQEEIPYWQK
jgi:DNA replication protein DnaC